MPARPAAAVPVDEALAAQPASAAAAAAAGAAACSVVGGDSTRGAGLPGALMLRTGGGCGAVCHPAEHSGHAPYVR